MIRKLTNERTYTGNRPPNISAFPNKEGEIKMKTVKQLLEDLVFAGYGILSYTQSAGVQYLNNVSIKELIDSGEIDEFDFYEEDDKDVIAQEMEDLFYGGLYRDFTQKPKYLAIRRFKNDTQFLELPVLD